MIYPNNALVMLLIAINVYTHASQPTPTYSHKKIAKRSSVPSIAMNNTVKWNFQKQLSSSLPNLVAVPQALEATLGYEKKSKKLELYLPQEDEPFGVFFEISGANGKRTYVTFNQLVASEDKVIIFWVNARRVLHTVPARDWKEEVIKKMVQQYGLAHYLEDVYLPVAQFAVIKNMVSVANIR